MTEPARCNRCHRAVVRSEPLWMLGKPYGPQCAKRYGLKAEAKIRATPRPVRIATPAQPPLWDDNEEQIDEEREEPT